MFSCLRGIVQMCAFSLWHQSHWVAVAERTEAAARAADLMLHKGKFEHLSVWSLNTQKLWAVFTPLFLTPHLRTYSLFQALTPDFFQNYKLPQPQ